MSEWLLVILIVLVVLAATFALGEWFARRMGSRALGGHPPAPPPETGRDPLRRLRRWGDEDDRQRD